MNTVKALLLLTSRPESMEVALRRMRPKMPGMIVSREILEVIGVAL